MAKLTTSYQQIAEAYLGSSYGTIYIRLYAKYSEQDIENNRTKVQYQARAYLTDSWIYDQQSNGNVSGTGASQVNYSKSNHYQAGETILGTTEGWVTHNTDGTKSVSGSAVLNFPNWGWSGTASGSAELPTIPRHFTNTPILEVTSKTETSLTIKWTTSEKASNSRYKIGTDGEWVNVESNIDKTTGTITINNLQVYTNYTVYVDLMRKDSGLWCSTPPSITEKTYNYPIIMGSLGNFTIGEIESTGFLLYNPLGRSVKIYLVADDDSEDEGVTTTGTKITKNYNTEAYKNFFYNSIPNKNSATLRYRVVCGALNYEHIETGGTYSTSLEECSPQFSNFNVKDSNADIVAVTGNNQAFVKGYSNLQVIIPSANKMVARKGATPSKYVATCDTLNQNANYSTNQVTINMGAIANNGTLRVNTRAYDSRNNYAVAYKDITVYDYAKPVINAIATRLNNFENQTTIQISGTYNKLTINGVDKNTLTSVKYRYRETGGTWGSWNTISATLNNGTFTCNNVILSLDNSKSFEIEIQVTDNIDSNSVSLSVDIGKSIFFISTTDRECYINDNKVIHNDDNGDVNLDNDLNVGNDINVTNDINVSNDISLGNNLNMGNNKSVKINNHTVLRHNGNATILSANNDNIYFRPKGDGDTTNQLYIDNNGVFQGLQKTLLQMIYPVGSIYLSVNDVNPKTFIGGEWTKIASGRTLVGVDTNDEDFETVEKNGGSKEHSHGSQDTRNGSLTAMIGTVDGDVYKIGYMGENHIPPNTYPTHYRNRTSNYQGGGGFFSHLTQVFGETASSNNMPPYFTCYIWKRTS